MSTAKDKSINSDVLARRQKALENLKAEIVKLIKKSELVSNQINSDEESVAIYSSVKGEKDNSQQLEFKISLGSSISGPPRFCPCGETYIAINANGEAVEKNCPCP